MNESELGAWCWHTDSEEMPPLPPRQASAPITHRQTPATVHAGVEDKVNKLVLFGLMLVGIGSADKEIIVLTTGESMEGHMLFADEDIVRFRDMHGVVEEIPREKISTIRLTGTSPKQQNAAAPATSTNAAPEAPEEQVRFCSLLASFQREQMAYMQETNPIRKAAMRVPDPYRYEAQVRDLFGPKHEFMNWTGSLRFGMSGRSVGIVFTPACEPQQVIQFGNAIEQPAFAAQDGAGTIIHIDSPIGRTLAGARSAEQPTIVSGTLVPLSGFARFSQALNGQANGGYGRALFRSQLNPAGASVAQPNYLVKFTSLNLLDQKAEAVPGAQ
jgi:hypothetical protein